MFADYIRQRRLQSVLPDRNATAARAQSKLTRVHVRGHEANSVSSPIRPRRINKVCFQVKERFGRKARLAPVAGVRTGASVHRQLNRHTAYASADGVDDRPGFSALFRSFYIGPRFILENPPKTERSNPRPRCVQIAVRRSTSRGAFTGGTMIASPAPPTPSILSNPTNLRPYTSAALRSQR